jgi:WhiB family redox-sensing transcriptional regulator
VSSPSQPDLDWQIRAACKGLPWSAFFAPDGIEEVVPPICHTCPVVGDCLAYAQLMQAEGVWGATTTEQRRLLDAGEERVRCPVCSSVEVLIEWRGSRETQLCLSCGVSWIL